MRTNPTRKTMPRLRGTDLRPYAGRWVAIVNGHIAGVGFTADEARTAAKLSRPKEEFEVRFVPEERPTSDL